jgi:hypothetical protein
MPVAHAIPSFEFLILYQGTCTVKRHIAPTAGKAERKAARSSAQGKARVLRDNRMNRSEQRQQTIARKGHPK